MNTRGVLACALLAVAACRAEAQRARVNVSGGEVTRDIRADPSRLSARIPGIESEQRARLRVGGDSAQRIAMNDFEWKGRVSSIEIDEEDARLYWDVKIIPDSIRRTIVRYRVDAVSGGILSIREFTGVGGLAANRGGKP